MAFSTTSPDNICVSAAASLKMFVWNVLHVQENKFKRDGKGEQKRKDFKYLCVSTLREDGYHLSWPRLLQSDDSSCISVSTHPVGPTVALPGHGCQLGVQEISGLVDTLRREEYKFR